MDLTKKLTDANNILIVVSNPIDNDCIGTSLSLKKILKDSFNKVSRIVAFTVIPEYFQKFDGIDQVEQVYLNQVDFQGYDLIILVDGNNWSQFFTNNWIQINPESFKEKLINIDHHQKGVVTEFLGDNCLIDQASCTSEVLYKYLIRPNNLKIDTQIADWMYSAAVWDTGNFEHGIYNKTYEFLQFLIENGANHLRAVNYTISKEMMDFTIWAIENTTYYSDHGVTALILTRDKQNEIAQKFGEDWDKKDITRYYKTVFARRIEGFPYSLIFTEDKVSDYTRASWRTINYGETKDLIQVLQAAGFDAGGHRNAGGARIAKGISEAVSLFLKALVD